MNIMKPLMLLGLVAVLAGCKISAAAFEGGDVISASNARHCLEGNTCQFSIDDTSFADTFTATPREGFVFTKWKGGDGFS
jgi:hypothetical protein